MTDRRLRLAALLMSVAGIGVAGYLTYVHFAEVKPLCGITSGCVEVQASEYAKLAGVPVALLGLAGYVLILASLFVRGEAALLAGAALALVGVTFSAYLTYHELFTIKAICQWCVVSQVLMLGLAGVTVARLLRADPHVRGAALPT
jgi:uncharacterized membrane protein